MYRPLNRQLGWREIIESGRIGISDPPRGRGLDRQLGWREMVGSGRVEGVVGNRGESWGAVWKPGGPWGSVGKSWGPWGNVGGVWGLWVLWGARAEAVMYICNRRAPARRNGDEYL